MDKLEREQLQKSLESLLETLKCPVCLLLVEKDSILCINGHALCRNCKRTQTSCPTCKSSFSNLLHNVFFSQILERIPHPCRFDECSHLVKPGEDHEKMYCRFRLTGCKYPNCGWEGTVDNILLHVEAEHLENQQVLKVGANKIYTVKTSKSFFANNNTALLISGCGHYFWQLTSHDSENNNVMRFTYQPLFLSKPDHDIYINIMFVSEENDEYDSYIRISKTNTTTNMDNFTFLFPYSVISKYFVEGDELGYNLLITKIMNQQSESESKISSPPSTSVKEAPIQQNYITVPSRDIVGLYEIIIKCGIGVLLCWFFYIFCDFLFYYYVKSSTKH